MGILWKKVSKFFPRTALSDFLQVLNLWMLELQQTLRVFYSNRMPEFQQAVARPTAHVSIPFKIDLQLFAAEDEGRTQPASERRRREEREKGNVPKSPEVASAIVLLSGIVLMYLMGEYFFMRSYYLLRKYFYGIHSANVISSEAASELLNQALVDITQLLLPLMGITVVAAIVGNVVQTGFLFAPRALAFNFGRIRPNFKKVLPNRQTLFGLAKSLVKVAVIGWVSYFVIEKDFFKILMLGNIGLEESIALITYTAFKIFIVVGILLLAISVADYFFQRYEYEEALKMTPSESKREMKEQDGDPSLQARRRQMARDQIKKSKMLAEVPKADVVITNPTHFAVALEYKPNKHRAPVVIAKGVDDFALRIIRVAKANDIVTVEDRPMARTLYDEVEIGQEVPAKFYTALSVIFTKLESFRKAFRNAS